MKCNKCGGRMRIICAVNPPDAVIKDTRFASDTEPPIANISCVNTARLNPAAIAYSA